MHLDLVTEPTFYRKLAPLSARKPSSVRRWRPPVYNLGDQQLTRSSQDGNGRTYRLTAPVPLVLAGYPPINTNLTTTRVLCCSQKGIPRTFS